MELMGVASTEQRHAKRRFVHAGGTMHAGETACIAWIKDVSDSGICLYTKHPLEVGEAVRVQLNAHRQGLQEVYDGIVIRVQASGAGAAFGVAISLRAVEQALLKSA